MPHLDFLSRAGHSPLGAGHFLLSFDNLAFEEYTWNWRAERGSWSLKDQRGVELLIVPLRSKGHRGAA